VREFDDFVDRCRNAVSQQVGGHTEAFQALWSHADDVVLMGAAGAHAVGWRDVSKSLTWASQHLNYTEWNAESLLTVVRDDVAITVDLEYMTRQVGGETDARTLRATQAYRVEDGQWRVIHRHGDPMADRIDVGQVARDSDG
jgi:ketosteroid isomerase-like protein